MKKAFGVSARAKAPLVDTRVIYCGDNLEQLKKFPDACVDLIYIDPPFNSNRNYEVFWGETKERRSFEDRHANTQAYLSFMRPRCEQLARVLKKTGSFYYHCDWHASHYIKVMLDQIFGENYFKNEIIWKRTNNPKGSQFKDKKYGIYTDSIFFYTNSNKYIFELDKIRVPLTQKELTEKYPHEDSCGRYLVYPILRSESKGERPNLVYEYKNYTPTKWGWVVNRRKLIEIDKRGDLGWTKNGTPFRKYRLEEDRGSPLGNLWDDIPRIQSNSHEALGYPTQKPLALLERIITASSNEGDVVLDAFCGCGTALEAAQRLKRHWIGIDISPTACRVMAQRLKTNTTLQEDEELWRAGSGFIVRDTAWTEGKLREVPPFEFENWAVITLGGKPNKTKVGDRGIDGRIYPVHAMPGRRGEAAGELAFTDVWFPIQVKQKDKVGRPDIDSFEAVMIREQRTLGYFVGFGFTSDALEEIDGFQKRQGLTIKPLTVRELLET